MKDDSKMGGTRITDGRDEKCVHNWGWKI